MPLNWEKSMVSSAERGATFGSDMTRHAALSPPDHLSWYAIQVRSQLGSVASPPLGGKVYEEVPPLYPARRRCADRIKELELPLFPGYLCCRFDVSDRLMPR